MSDVNKHEKIPNDLKNIELQPHERIIYDVIEPPADVPDSGVATVEKYDNSRNVYDCDRIVDFYTNLPFRRSNVVKLEPLKLEDFPIKTGAPVAPMQSEQYPQFQHPIVRYGASVPERPLQQGHPCCVVVGHPYPQYGYGYPAYHQGPATRVHKPQRRV